MGNTNTAQQLAGEICFYGTSATGAGWLAVTREGRMLGTGEPSASASFTSALWSAVEALRAAGAEGLVRVFASGGAVAAIIDTRDRAPYYGDLRWSAAPQYVISAEALERAR